MHFLYRDLDLISFHREDTAFIISVAGGARAAEDLVAVRLEACCQFLHLLSASDAERDMCVAGADGRLGQVGHTGLIHQLEACTLPEGKEVCLLYNLTLPTKA